MRRYSVEGLSTRVYGGEAERRSRDAWGKRVSSATRAGHHIHTSRAPVILGRRLVPKMRGCEIRTCDQKKGPPAIYAAGPTVQQVLRKLNKYKRLIRGLTNDNTMYLNLLSRSRGSNARLTKRPCAIYTTGLSTQQILRRLDVYKGFTRGPHNDDQRGFPSCSHLVSARSLPPTCPRLAV